MKISMFTGVSVSNDISQINSNTDADANTDTDADTDLNAIWNYFCLMHYKYQGNMTVYKHLHKETR